MHPQTGVDHYRKSLTLPRRLMPSVLAIHAGSRCASDAVAELRAGGVIATDSLDPLVADMIAVITNPNLVVTVEVTPGTAAGNNAIRLATVWRGRATAVIGQTDDRRRFQLLQVEPELLPFHIAQVVGLAQLSQPQFDGSFVIPSPTLSKVEGLVATNPALALAELTDAGVASHWSDRLLNALLLRRSLWTAESVWLGSSLGRDESRMSILDGGFAGYWRLSPGPDANVIVTSVGFDDLLAAIAALIPGRR